MADLTAADIKAVTDGNNNGYAYPVYPAPMYNYGGYGGFGGGFGMDGSWIWIIALLAMCGGFGGFGMGGFGGLGGLGMGGLGGGLIGYGMGMNATKTDLSDGLTALQTSNKIDNVSTQIGNGFANAATQLCGGLADVTAAVTNGTNAINTGMLQGFANTNLANCQNTNAINNAINNSRFDALQSANAIQAQIAQNGFNAQQCCCDTKTAIADLKYNTLLENAADRTAINNGIRDILVNQTANTQKILDTLCQDKIDAKNETIAQLRQELLYARGQASQIEQTAQLRAGQVAEVDALYNRLSNCPVPSTPVYGRTPIFTCNNGCGCNGYNQFIN